MSNKPILTRLESECRATLTLLPYVAALPFLDDEALAAIFGLTMRILNWLPEVPLFPEFKERKRRKPTAEENRRYWREYQRDYRERKRRSSLQSEND